MRSWKKWTAGPTFTRDAFVSVERNPQIVAAASLAILAGLAIGVVLYVARSLLMPIVVAFVFAVILAPICRRLEQIRTPRPIAALAALLFASILVYQGFALVAEPAAEWIADAPQLLRKADLQIRKLQSSLSAVQNISREVEDLSLLPQAGQETPTVVVERRRMTEILMASAQVFFVQLAFVIVLTYFFLITREDFRLKLIAFQPRLHQRVRLARAFRDIGHRVNGYIVAFSLINVAFGAAVGVACWQLGLPQAAMWGGLAGLLNFVPYLGPAVTVGLLGLAGLATFDTLLAASLPVLAYLCINFIESSIVTPLVMSRRMTLNPLAIMLAVSFWTWMWGPVGGLISLPVLIMLKCVCDHTPSLRALGAVIGAPLTRTGLLRARKMEQIAGRMSAPAAVPGDPEILPVSATYPFGEPPATDNDAVRDPISPGLRPAST